MPDQSQTIAKPKPNKGETIAKTKPNHSQTIAKPKQQKDANTIEKLTYSVATQMAKMKPNNGRAGKVAKAKTYEQFLTWSEAPGLGLGLAWLGWAGLG